MVVMVDDDDEDDYDNHHDNGDNRGPCPAPFLSSAPCQVSNQPEEGNDNDDADYGNYHHADHAKCQTKLRNAM